MTHRRQPVAAVLAVTCVVLLASAQPTAADTFDAPTLDFLRQVDAATLDTLAVLHRGRPAAFGAFARDQLVQITGGAGIDGLPASVAWLELHFRTEAYLHRPILHVREKAMREHLGAYLPPAEADWLREHRRLAPARVLSRQAAGHLVATGRAGPGLLDRLDQTDSLQGALDSLPQRPQLRPGVERLSGRLGALLAEDHLRIVPTPAQWVSVGAIAPGAASPEVQAVADAFAQLREAWQRRDVAATNRASHDLQAAARHAGGAAYPSPGILRAELTYHRLRHLTPVWAGFAAGMVLLIPAAAVPARWRRLRRGGLALLGLSTAGLLAGFLVRWIVSGREWYLPPIMNQFEAVTASALLAACVALGLELATRRGFYGVAGAFYCTVALLCGMLFPEAMGAGISAPAGILASPAMALHVGTIIIGHAFVGMSGVLSVGYLLALAAGGRRRARAWGAGGAGQDVSAPPDLRAPAGASLAASIDRANLVVVQLAAWTVALGTVLGAWWADFAWNRWWGWDPKETWALLTVVVLLGVVHLRFAVGPQRRGMLTAIGGLLACGAMLFNWIIVNYLLPGLHSYA